MSLTLATLAAGDLSYISKHNSNYAAIAAAVDSLNSLLSGTSSAAVTAPVSFEVLFGASNAVIGVGSYQSSTNGTDFILTAGYAWLAGSMTTVKKTDTTTIAFSGLATGTYYIHIGVDGVPYRDQTASNIFYTIVWSGSGFTTITLNAKIAWAYDDWERAQVSTVLATSFNRLDERLEAIELRAVQKRIQAVTGNGAQSLNWGAYDVIRFTANGNTTFTFTGARDAQNCLIELVSNGYTMTWPGNIRAPDDIPFPVALSAVKMDRVGFQYCSVGAYYDVVALVKGY